MPRKRMSSRTNWPVGLYQKVLRGKRRYYYKFLDGSSEYFDSSFTELEAIELGRLLSQEDRSPEKLRLIKQERNDPFNILLKNAIPMVIDRVTTNKELGPSKFKTFIADCDRFVTLLGDIPSKKYSSEHVNAYLQKYVVEEGKSNGVYNSKISFLNRIEKWLKDMSLINGLFAKYKAKLKVAAKDEQPLQMEHFIAIYEAAPHFLKVAMELAYNTTHSVQEIHNARYDDCSFLSKPELDDSSGLKIYGFMRIHRLKVEEKEASRVEIPITESLNELIKSSRADNVVSPYIVHDLPRRNSKQSQECDHPTQCSRGKISKTFSKVRDSLDLTLHIPKKGKRSNYSEADFEVVKMRNVASEKKPGFHGIRGLSMRQLNEIGVDPQARAAHTDSRSTKVYIEDNLKWTRVPAVNMRF